MSLFSTIKKLTPSTPLKGIRVKEIGLTSIYVKRSLKSNTRHLCPNCGGNMHPVQQIDPSQNEVSQVILSCEICPYEEDVTAVIKNAATAYQSLASAEKQYALLALAMLIGSSIIAVILGNIFTFVGGCLLTIVLMLYAMLMNYKQWQIRNGRLFETKAPIKDYIRDFIRS